LGGEEEVHENVDGKGDTHTIIINISSSTYMHHESSSNNYVSVVLNWVDETNKTRNHQLSRILRMLTLNLNAISSSWVLFLYLPPRTPLFLFTFIVMIICFCMFDFRFSIVPFHANYALSTQTLLFSSNLNYSFATTGGYTLTVFVLPLSQFLILIYLL